MMIRIENDFFLAELKPEGAELTRLYDKVHAREMLWYADPAVWKRHSPVLFPVVGRCKNYEMRYQGKTYHMPQHGFCQDALFQVESASETHVTFSLSASDETRAIYPFEFTFFVSYHLDGEKLVFSYLIRNEDQEDPMYFSLGGHPGFLYDGPVSDQIIEFSEKETLDRVTLGPTFQFSREVEKDYIKEGAPIHLDEHIYDHDALVFHNFKSKEVAVYNPKTGRGVKVSLAGFPYVGFWSMPGACYTCVEPWFGLADYEDFEGELPEKDGIEKIEKGGEFKASFSVKAM